MLFSDNLEKKLPHSNKTLFSSIKKECQIKKN